MYYDPFTTPAYVQDVAGATESIQDDLLPLKVETARLCDCRGMVTHFSPLSRLSVSCIFAAIRAHIRKSSVAMAKNTTSHRFRLDLIIARDGDEVNEEHQPTNTNGSKPRIVDKQRNVAGIMVACPIEVSIV